MISSTQISPSLFLVLLHLLPFTTTRPIIANRSNPDEIDTGDFPISFSQEANKTGTFNHPISWLSAYFEGGIYESEIEANWSMMTNGSDDEYVVLREDEFKGWKGVIFKAAVRTGKFSVKAMKQLRAAGKKLAKFGKKIWQKGLKKGFKAFKSAAREALYIAPDLAYQYADYEQQRRINERERAENSADERDAYIGPEEGPVQDGDREEVSNVLYDPKSGKVVGMPSWAAGVVAVVVIAMCGGCCVFLYLGGKTDFERRRKRHRDRKRRGESESGETEKSEAGSTTEVPTMVASTMATSKATEAATTITEAPTVTTRSMAATSAITATVSVAAKPKKKKKVGRVRKALDQVEKSLYAPAKKGRGAKGKKKKLGQTQKSKMVSTMASEVGQSEPTSAVTEPTTAEVSAKVTKKQQKKSAAKKSVTKKASAKKSTAKKKGE